MINLAIPAATYIKRSAARGPFAATAQRHGMPASQPARCFSFQSSSPSLHPQPPPSSSSTSTSTAFPSLLPNRQKIAVAATLRPPPLPSMEETESRRAGGRPDPAPPVPWYTRAAEAIGLKSQGDHRTAGFNPRRNPSDPSNVGVICYPDRHVYVSRSEAYRLKRYLEKVLQEVKLVIGSLPEGAYECEDPVSQVIEPAHSDLGLKHIASIVLGIACIRRPGAFQTLRQAIYPGYNPEHPQKTSHSIPQVKKESENVHHVDVVQSFTKHIKAVIKDNVQTGSIAPDCARELLMIVDELNCYAARELSRNGSRLFSLDGLKKVFQFPKESISVPDMVSAFGSGVRKVFTAAGAAYRVTHSAGPGIFENIGVEAFDLIKDPFEFQHFGCTYSPLLAIVGGAEITARQNLQKNVSLRLKNEILSLCLKASCLSPGLGEPNIQAIAEEQGADKNGNSYCGELFFENILDKAGTNSMFFVPHSLKKSKVELQVLQTFYGVAGSIGLNGNTKPCAAVSGLFGVQDLNVSGVDSIGFGGKLEVNDANAWAKFSAGISVRAQLLNFGFLFNQPGNLQRLCAAI